MKQPKKEHIIRRLLWEARPIWKWLLLAALLCIGVIVCGVLGPKLLGGLIDRLYAWWDGSDRSDLLAGLLRPMGWLALVYLGYSLFSYVKMQLLNRVVSRYFTCELRIRISDKIRRLPVSYVDQTPVGDILSHDGRRVHHGKLRSPDHRHAHDRLFHDPGHRRHDAAGGLAAGCHRPCAHPGLHPAVDAPVLPQ